MQENDIILLHIYHPDNIIYIFVIINIIIIIILIIPFIIHNNMTTILTLIECIKFQNSNDCLNNT